MKTIDHLTYEEREEVEQYANCVVAQVLRKHARLLRERAATHDLHKRGLIDAAELTEATAHNLEAFCR